MSVPKANDLSEHRLDWKAVRTLTAPIAVAPSLRQSGATRLPPRRVLWLALASILGARWRASFAAVTVLLGAMAIAATFTIDANTGRYVEAATARWGGGVLFASVPRTRELRFTEQDMRLLASLPHVARVSHDLQAMNVTVRSGDVVLTPVLLGLALDDAAHELRAIAGAGFVTPDRAEAILNPSAVTRLKLQQPVGQLISARGAGADHALHVVGVAERKKLDDSDRALVWVSPSTFRHLTGESLPTGLRIDATSAAGLRVLEPLATRYLVETYGDDLNVHNPLVAIERLRSDMQSVLLAGMVLGLLSLFAGSVGTMNIMMISIRLRRREIGLYRALGFSRRSILALFICESSFISTAGGVVGSAVGGVVGMGLSELVLGTPGSLDWAAMLAALAATVVVGALFGLGPALRGANMDPVEALRG